MLSFSGQKEVHSIIRIVTQLEVEVHAWTLDLASLKSCSAQLLSDKYAVQEYEEISGPFR